MGLKWPCEGCGKVLEEKVDRFALLTSIEKGPEGDQPGEKTRLCLECLEKSQIVIAEGGPEGHGSKVALKWTCSGCKRALVEGLNPYTELEDVESHEVLRLCPKCKESRLKPHVEEEKKDE